MTPCQAPRDQHAASLYLCLVGKGATLCAEPDPTYPSGYALGVRWPVSNTDLTEEYEELRTRITQHRLGLLKILLCRCDPNARSVREEGGV